MQVIIKDQFKSGPGHEKVFAGEYELFCTDDSSKIITEHNISLLCPGSTVTMAMIIGRYSESPKNVCPRPGCHSHCIIRSDAGGMIW
jgi:hypothetical protein